MNKEYTTPTLCIRIPDGKTYIENAQRTIVTLKSSNWKKDYEETVIKDDDMLIVNLSQGETGRFGSGALKIEVTLVMETGAVLKTKTVQTTLEEALRKEVA